MMCSNCVDWPDQIGSFRAAFVFGGVIREAIHRFKYLGEFARARSLADLMCHALFRPEFVEMPSWDHVAYVPLHRRRRRQRGFDQSELLSRYGARKLELPVVAGLVRTVDTQSQVGLGEDERRSNVRGAFDWVDKPLSGERILLIDDVVTTGATIMAAASALISVGAGRVDGFALARELRD